MLRRSVSLALGLRLAERGLTYIIGAVHPQLLEQSMSRHLVSGKSRQGEQVRLHVCIRKLSPQDARYETAGDGCRVRLSTRALLGKYDRQKQHGSNGRGRERHHTYSRYIPRPPASRATCQASSCVAPLLADPFPGRAIYRPYWDAWQRASRWILLGLTSILVTCRARWGRGRTAGPQAGGRG